jgi:hypothetical protein
MKRIAVRLGLAAGLLLLGWAAGQAQSAQPDFEIIVDAPQGATNVTCVRGCALAWVERGTSTPMPKFRYECTGARCTSGRVGGWIRR